MTAERKAQADRKDQVEHEQEARRKQFGWKIEDTNDYQRVLISPLGDQHNPDNTIMHHDGWHSEDGFLGLEDSRWFLDATGEPHFIYGAVEVGEEENYLNQERLRRVEKENKEKLLQLRLRIREKVARGITLGRFSCNAEENLRAFDDDNDPMNLRPLGFTRDEVLPEHQYLWDEEEYMACISRGVNPDGMNSFDKYRRIIRQEKWRKERWKPWKRWKWWNDRTELKTFKVWTVAVAWVAI